MLQRIAATAPAGTGSEVPGLSAELVRCLLALPTADRDALLLGLQTWNPQLGDQVATVTVTRAGASETGGQPAVDLSDGLELQATGDIGPRRHNGGTVYQVGVVPDGVARATWTYRVLRLVNRFATPTRRTIAVHPQITGNVAYSPKPSRGCPGRRGTFGDDGPGVIVTQ